MVQGYNTTSNSNKILHHYDAELHSQVPVVISIWCLKWWLSSNCWQHHTPKAMTVLFANTCTQFKPQLGTLLAFHSSFREIKQGNKKKSLAF